MIHLFQSHTVSLYGLDQKSYSIEKVSAKSLLKPSRFDLFAKLVYIRYRKSNPEFALKIYSEHIKAFNPDLKEPGRDDKNGLQDFIDSFDKLIDYFSENEFDENISLIPVSDDGTILDGSHRLAALIYFDKEVTIARFVDVKPVAVFNYEYFLIRGISFNTVSLIAKESINFLNKLSLIVFQEGNLPQDFLLKNQMSIIFYKRVRLSLDKYRRLLIDSELKINEENMMVTRETNFYFILGEFPKDYKNSIDEHVQLENIVGLIFSSKIKGYQSFFSKIETLTDKISFKYRRTYLIRVKTWIKKRIK